MRKFTVTIMCAIASACSCVSFAAAAEIRSVATSTSISNLTPTTSVAYFGELAGEPARYSVIPGGPFILNATILSPDVPGSKKDFSVTIRNGAHNVVATFGGTEQSGSWTREYEPWSGQWYWRGAEFKAGLPPDDYFLTVSNQGNIGKYVLVLGGNDPAPNSLAALFTVESYFGKPSAFFQSRSGGLMLLTLIIFIILVWFVASWRK